MLYILCVLTDFTNMNTECLPKAIFTRLMYAESRRLSQLQVAEELLKDYDENSSRTLHTDGTSKFVKHYGTYDAVSDQGQTLTAGIREVSSDDTKTQLNVLIDIFSEVEQSLQSSEENVSNKVISSIKNIMSDTLFKKKLIPFSKITVDQFCQQYLKIGIPSVKTFKKILLRLMVFLWSSFLSLSC